MILISLSWGNSLRVADLISLAVGNTIRYRHRHGRLGLGLGKAEPHQVEHVELIVTVIYPVLRIEALAKRIVLLN